MSKRTKEILLVIVCWVCFALVITLLITLLFIQSKKEYEKYELNFKPRTTIINGEGVHIKYDNYTNYIPLKESGLVTEVNKTNTEVEYKLKEGIEYIKDKKSESIRIY